MPPIRQPKGWLFPGYRYLGPFNPSDNGEPVNAADKAAQKHDQSYNHYINQGHNPYLYFNKADQQFLDDLRGDWSAGALAGKAVFGVKKAIAPALGEKKTAPGAGGGPPAKQAKVQAAKRKLYFARSNKGAKQAKMADSNEVEGAGDGPPEEQPSTSGGAPAPSMVDARSGSGGGGGGGMGGGGSVGVSTGGWEGGTHFHANGVTTVVTRQWYARAFNNHTYSTLSSNNLSLNNDPAWIGIQTPWGYFNFNCYRCHFSPNDWQRLTNEYVRWRPTSMHVKIYNLQIKQIVSLGNDTLYNNDLTAGVHIMCDGSGQYPDSANGWDEQLLPEIPTDIYTLPQYAYYQANGDLVSDGGANTVNNSTERHILANVPLFMLETSHHQVLRTGESTEMRFSFSCGWVKNDRTYQPPQAGFNPLVGTRRKAPQLTVRAGNAYEWSSSNYSPYKKPSIWMPGPGYCRQGWTRATGHNYQDGVRGPWWVAYAPTGSQPEGVIQYANNYIGTQYINEDSVRTYGYAINPAGGASNAMHDKDVQFNVNREQDQGNSANVLSTEEIDFTRWYNAGFVQNSGGNDPQNNNAQWAYQNVIYMYPNQLWNGPTLSRENPIWTRVPRTDFKTILDCEDGTLPMEHPPGTIYVKVSKIPIPSDTANPSFLNLYVTGQITVAIEWEAERYSTKNWRPETRTSATNFNKTNVYNFDDQGRYIIPDEYNQCMPTRQGMTRVTKHQ
ncbi:capsid protein [Bocaparvovirus lagomorph1]|uniref:Minor capsid protein VP1 n=1 Tax=Bocaparvovirus lagomorph1 TaxID=3052037 RepID=A0A0U3BGQ5_9VIRU|nr:capsid protein [Bocaparvovirus lagomorph1]ALT04902.1 capsid protein [Bocaparvovirus lagomorph1]